MACFTEPEDSSEIDEAEAIFEILWDGARALSKGTLEEFKRAWLATRRIGSDPETAIVKAVGKVEPPNVSVTSQNAKIAEIALERLRRQIQEEYRPAFEEVGAVLAGEGLERLDVAEIGPHFRTNRFLAWVRSAHVPGDTWKEAKLRDEAERRAEIIRLGHEWIAAADGGVYEGYTERIKGVLDAFADPTVLASASRDRVMAGLQGIHAFTEQFHFTSGGGAALPARFWQENNNDLSRVRETLGYLLHGNGDFVDRLHTVTTDPHRKVAMFGKFCGLELCGTVRPSECPPVNGRSAKALRFLGFKVTAN